MKLTKETLKQIIKEELEATVEEGLFGFSFKKKKEEPAEQPAEKPVRKADKHNIEDLKSAIEQSSATDMTKDEAVILVDQMGKLQSVGWIDTNLNGLRDAEDKEGYLSGMISDLQRSGGL